MEWISTIALPRELSSFQASAFFGCGVYRNTQLHSLRLPMPSFSPAGFRSLFHPKAISMLTEVMPGRHEAIRMEKEPQLFLSLFHSRTSVSITANLKPRQMLCYSLYNFILVIISSWGCHAHLRDLHLTEMLTNDPFQLHPFMLDCQRILLSPMWEATALLMTTDDFALSSSQYFHDLASVVMHAHSVCR